MSGPHDNNRCAGCGAIGEERHASDCRFGVDNTKLSVRANYALKKGRDRWGIYNSNGLVSGYYSTKKEAVEESKEIMKETKR